VPRFHYGAIGDAGGSLSGGEKQRISIARALLKDAPIIILDEATASIDPENEHLINAALFELTRDKTVIAIAHRLNGSVANVGVRGHRLRIVTGAS
jgi:ATP-binding cassette subfamily B protein IrtB